MAAQFPLPPPPNFRVAKVDPTYVRLAWSDFPTEVKQDRRIKGYRLYKSATPGELGLRIADENTIGPATFQYDDAAPDAGPNRYYVLVAVED